MPKSTQTGRDSVEFELKEQDGKYVALIRAPGNRAELFRSQAYDDKDDALRAIDIVMGTFDDKT